MLLLMWSNEKLKKTKWTQAFSHDCNIMNYWKKQCIDYEKKVFYKYFDFVKLSNQTFRRNEWVFCEILFQWILFLEGFVYMMWALSSYTLLRWVEGMKGSLKNPE